MLSPPIVEAWIEIRVINYELNIDFVASHSGGVD